MDIITITKGCQSQWESLVTSIFTNKKQSLIMLLIVSTAFFVNGQTITSSQLSSTGNPLQLMGADATNVVINNTTDGLGSDNNGAGYRTGTDTATTDRTYTISFEDAGGNPVFMNSVELDLGFFNNDVDNPNPGNGGLEGINNISTNNGSVTISYLNEGGEGAIDAFYTDYFPAASSPNSGNWVGIPVPPGTIYAPNDNSFGPAANGTATITSTQDFSSITFTHDYLSSSGNPFGIVISEIRYTAVVPCLDGASTDGTPTLTDSDGDGINES